MGLEAVKLNQEDRFQKQFRYHHGNLRATLVEAALEILQNEGIEELSLRSIARKSNVSQAAPYSHFKNKKELLAAVAETGFQRLSIMMSEASGLDGTTQQKVERMATSYITFANENKPLFQLMFSNELSDMSDCRALAEASSKPLEIITSVVSSCADANTVSTSILGTVHGITSLTVGGKIKFEKLGASSANEMMRKTLSVFSSSFK